MKKYIAGGLFTTMIFCLIAATGDFIMNSLVTVEKYDVDYVIIGGSASIGPTAPTFTVNDSCAGPTFDADNESLKIFYEIPSCYADGASDDLYFKIYFCGEDAQHPAQGEKIKFDISYRSIDWGAEDVDNGATVTGTATYTEADDPGDEGDSYELSITLDADHGDQPLNAGDVLAIHFDRDWSDGANYPHDAIVSLFEVRVPQTSLLCDHNN